MAKTIRFPYVHYFPVISCVEALGLIHKCVGCEYSLYSHIQRLVVELNSNTVRMIKIAHFSVGKLLLHHYESDLAHTSDRYSSVIELYLS